MTARTWVLAPFGIVGVITYQFVDEVSAVAVHGFEFWIASDDSTETLQKGMPISCSLHDLELYV